MEKILFSSGGQPVCLDDLQTLQNSARAALAAIVAGLTGGAQAVLVNKVEREIVSSADGRSTWAIGAGTVIVDGYLYPFDAQEVVVPDGAEPFVCMEEEEQDYRTFADGQLRGTRLVLTSYLSATGEGVRSWPLKDLPTLADARGVAGGEVSEWQSVSVRFTNSYSGFMRLRYVDDGDVEFNLSASTPKGGVVQIKSVCYLSDVTPLAVGTRTPYITAEGYGEYALLFQVGNAITLDSREHLEGGVSTAYMPRVIDATWKLSEMVTINT